MVPVSSLAKIEDNHGGSYDACDPSCPSGQFCGSDLACHAFSCDEWYKYAGTNWTDYDPDVPLTCTDRSQFDPEYEGLTSPAVVFGCAGFANKLPERPEAVYQAFTRRCTRADQDRLGKFTCYEMAEKTNFQQFVVDAQNANLDPCKLDGSPDVPSFIYQAQSYHSTGYPSYYYFYDTGGFTQEFVRVRGMDTMFANLTIVDNIPIPTPSPTSVSVMASPGAAMFAGILFTLRLCFGG